MAGIYEAVFNMEVYEMIEQLIWHSSLEEARVEAQETNKELIIDLYNTG